MFVDLTGWSMDLSRNAALHGVGEKKIALGGVATVGK